MEIRAIKGLALMDELLGQYPGGLARDELAERIGQSLTSGSFRSYVSRLTSNGIAESRDGVLYATSLVVEGA